MPRLDWHQLESIVRADFAHRGVPQFKQQGRWLGEGGLAAAAESLAGGLGQVAIVTGFCVIDGDRVTAETDGPPGALFLARAIAQRGGQAVLLSDQYGTPLLEAGRQLWQLDEVALECCPGESVDAWIDDFLRRYAGLTHLVAIERVGPSHTPQSLAAQSRRGPTPDEAFCTAVPLDHQNLCHNMRGRPIDDLSPPLYRLFEMAPRGDTPLTTIAVADGGNEIGMGKIPWECLCEAIATGPAGQVACRIGVDQLVVAGVCNWGAYALACAAAMLAGRGELISRWTRADQCRLIAHLVASANARDGITGRREPTVDTVSLDQYGQQFDAIRAWALENTAR
jgi:hypothetical protein